MKFNVNDALDALGKVPAEFLELFETPGGATVEIYKPEGVDTQSPHDRDEFYVVISGTGEFVNGDQRMTFEPGDVLFVPKEVDHRFEYFTPDFATWVFFVD